MQEQTQNDYRSEILKTQEQRFSIFLRDQDCFLEFSSELATAQTNKTLTISKYVPTCII